MTAVIWKTLSFSNISGFSSKKNNDGTYLIKVDNTVELNKLIDLIRSNEKFIKEIIPSKSSLEETFIELINESNKENRQ